MGLTVHYSLTSRVREKEKAAALVRQMRQLAMDLPFEKVSQVIDYEGAACRVSDDPEVAKKDRWRWLKIQAEESIDYPWSKSAHGNRSMRLPPSRLIAFEVDVGEGSEPANIGLCCFPAEVELDYRPKDDRKFQKDGEFSYRKWYHSELGSVDPDAVLETRKVKTRLGGWRWGSFCKTQYASNVSLENFLRCHISVITLLERISELPGLKVNIDDEGHYGPSVYSDDHLEARAAGREPTYVSHRATHSLAVLAKELGEYNQLVACLAGGLGDAARAGGMSIESPITQHPQFEQLEFFGARDPKLSSFLSALTDVVQKTASGS